MNIALLDRLREADGRPVPLDALGTDPDAVRRDLQVLEAFGFRLEYHPYQGVTYLGAPGRLCPDQIEWDLGTRHVGRRIAVWSRVSSTNDLAARAAGSQANDGLVIIAEEQTQGRGRLGRSWVAPPGSSLLLSLLLFPPPELAQVCWMTTLGAVAAAEVVEQFTGRPADIKWPNDVRVAARKLAGVLVERRHGWVVGIGLNVNIPAAAFPPELRETATALSLLAGRALDRSEVARALIRRLDARYTQGLDHGLDPLESAWRSRLECLGGPVRVQTRERAVEGRWLEADFNRGLLVEPPGAAPFWIPHQDDPTIRPPGS